MATAGVDTADGASIAFGHVAILVNGCGKACGAVRDD